jgi:hypothetical protein
MNRKLKAFLCPTGIPCVMVLLGGVLTAPGTTVYSNNFNSGAASLAGLAIVNESSSSSVSVDSGQLRIDPAGAPSSYVVANTASFAAPYSSTLKNNPGTVTWAFNVSNQDGGLNNGFFFSVASSAISPLVYTSSSYLLFGGVFVGNRMEFNGVGSGFPSHLLFEIPSANGLGPLPSKGSFRITYEPSTDLWSVYGEVGADYVDPTTVTTLLGSVVDSTYTSVPLPYMAWGGQDTGSDFFDNVSVTVAPEPSAMALVVLGLAMGAAFFSRSNNKTAPGSTTTGPGMLECHPGLRGFTVAIRRRRNVR